MNRLQELREEKGLNKQEMADELGLAYTTYIGYEKGDRDPKSEKWKEFARHFGVSVDYLIGISETKIPVTTKDDGHNDNNSILSEEDRRVLAWYYSQSEETRKLILSFPNAQETKP